MYFSKVAILSLVASAIALPTSTHDKRALQAQSYAQFQVSDGVGGNALAEVAQKFPVAQFTANLAGVSASDLTILNAARVTAEDAETGTGGFNDAIAAAGASTAKGKALQVGKIKNKVLKLQLEVLGLQIQQAQGSNNQAKITTEQTKLNNNIKLDQANAGQTSQSVNFQGSS